MPKNKASIVVQVRIGDRWVDYARGEPHEVTAFHARMLEDPEKAYRAVSGYGRGEVLWETTPETNPLGTLSEGAVEIDIGPTKTEIKAGEKKRWTLEAAKLAHRAGDYVPERAIKRIPPEWFAKHGITSGFIEDELLPHLAETERHLGVPEVPLVMVLGKTGEMVRTMAYRGYDPYAPFIAVSFPLEFGFAQHINMIPFDQVIPFHSGMKKKS